MQDQKSKSSPLIWVWSSRGQIYSWITIDKFWANIFSASTSSCWISWKRMMIFARVFLESYSLYKHRVKRTRQSSWDRSSSFSSPIYSLRQTKKLNQGNGKSSAQVWAGNSPKVDRNFQFHDKISPSLTWAAAPVGTYCCTSSKPFPVMGAKFKSNLQGEGTFY